MHMSDKTYNGWTNYATWRVNLEMIDGSYWYDFDPDFEKPEFYELAQTIKEWAEDLIVDSSPKGLVQDYALAFLSDVNWNEIAKHILSECAKENAE
jgi:hypothetical protein